jgi:hypothetical protein
MHEDSQSGPLILEFSAGPRKHLIYDVGIHHIFLHMVIGLMDEVINFAAKTRDVEGVVEYN